MAFGQPTKVAEVVVRGGQDVKKDQVILRGDDTEENALLRLQQERAKTDLPVRRAKAAMDLAEVEHKRLQDIFAKGGSGAQEVERARLTAVQAALDYAMAQLTQTTEVIQVDRFQARVDRFQIIAPFDGTVSTVQVDVGQSVGESDRIVRVVNVDTLMMDVGAEIGEARTWTLKEGDTAWVLVDVAGTARLCKGKVTEVDPTADLGSRSRRVRVEMPNPKGDDRLLAGGPAWVRFTEPGPELLSKFNLGAGASGTPVAGR